MKSREKEMFNNAREWDQRFREFLVHHPQNITIIVPLNGTALLCTIA
jgi:hypothetical protein